jgi:hypothetical protein
MIYSVGIIVLVVACAMMYRVVYEPLRHELRYLHQQISNETPDSINRASTSLGEYDQWLAGLQISELQLRHQFTQMVSKAHVQLKEMRFDAKTSSTPFIEMPIYLKLTGTFSSVSSFFVTLANSHLIFDFKKLALSKSGSMIQAAILLHLRTLG